MDVSLFSNHYFVRCMTEKDIAEIYINGKKTGEIETNAFYEQDFPKAFKVYSSDKTEKIVVSFRIKEIDDKDTNEKTITETENIVNREDIKEIEKNEITEQTNSKNFELWGIAYTNN